MTAKDVAKAEAEKDAADIKEKAKTNAKGAAEQILKELDDASKDDRFKDDEAALKEYKKVLAEKLLKDNKTLEDKKAIGSLVIEFSNAHKDAIGLTDKMKKDEISAKANQVRDTDPVAAAMLDNLHERYAELKNEFRDDGSSKGTEDTVDGLSFNDLNARMKKDQKEKSSSNDAASETEAANAEAERVKAAKEAGIEPYEYLSRGKYLYDVAREKLEKMNSVRKPEEQKPITNADVFREVANIMNRSNTGLSQLDPEKAAAERQRSIPLDWNKLTSRNQLVVYTKEDIAALKAAKEEPSDSNDGNNDGTEDGETQKTSVKLAGGDERVIERKNGKVTSITYTKENGTRNQFIANEDGTWTRKSSPEDKGTNVGKSITVKDNDTVVCQFKDPKSKKDVKITSYANGTLEQIKGDERAVLVTGANRNDSEDDEVYTSQDGQKWLKGKGDNATQVGQVKVNEENGEVTVDGAVIAQKVESSNPNEKVMADGSKRVVEQTNGQVTSVTYTDTNNKQTVYKLQEGRWVSSGDNAIANPQSVTAGSDGSLTIKGESQTRVDHANGAIETQSGNTKEYRSKDSAGNVIVSAETTLARGAKHTIVRDGSGNLLKVSTTDQQGSKTYRRGEGDKWLVNDGRTESEFNGTVEVSPENKVTVVNKQTGETRVEYASGTVVTTKDKAQTIETMGANPNDPADDVVYSTADGVTWRKGQEKTPVASVTVNDNGNVTEVATPGAQQAAPQNLSAQDLEEGRRWLISNFDTIDNAIPNSSKDQLIHFSSIDYILEHPDDFKQLALDDKKIAYLKYVAAKSADIAWVNDDESVIGGETYQFSRYDLNNWTYAQLKGQSQEKLMELGNVDNEQTTNADEDVVSTLYAKINTNQDETMDLKELEDYLATHGASGDKTLTAEQEQSLKRHLKSQSEARRRFIVENFGKIDSDGDGWITDTELTNFKGAGSYGQKKLNDVQKRFIDQLKAEQQRIADQADDEYDELENDGITMNDMNNDTQRVMQS